MLTTKMLIKEKKMFIGRKEELESIKTRLDSNGYELGIIYGQRRIGKTSIILEAIKDYSHLYFLARDASYRNNLDYFTTQYSKYLKTPFTPFFDTFDALFDSILEQVSKQKIVIVIDELPFLAKNYPGVISYLQGFCVEIKRNGLDIKIILSGSDMSFMVDLLENKAKPLYQRSTFKIHVKPMVFSDAVEMLKGLSNLDIIKYLSIFGNRPYYLDKINKSLSFEDNIINLCFNKSSILLDAPNITLPLGYTTNSIFVSILIAISQRRKRVKDIADELRIEDNALATYLLRMMEGTAIEKRSMFNGNRKTNYYEITDPFMRFYYRIIYPNQSEIENGLGYSIYKETKDDVEDIINHSFEDVVISYLNEQNQLLLLPEPFHQFQNYVVDNSSLGRSIDIDALADSLNGKTLLVVEAKFRNRSLSMKVLEHLKESASIFSKYQNIHYYLFSKSSFSDDLLKLDDSRVKLITIDTMCSK